MSKKDRCDQNPEVGGGQPGCSSLISQDGLNKDRVGARGRMFLRNSGIFNRNAASNRLPPSGRAASSQQPDGAAVAPSIGSATENGIAADLARADARLTSASSFHHSTPSGAGALMADLQRQAQPHAAAARFPGQELATESQVTQQPLQTSSLEDNLSRSAERVQFLQRTSSRRPPDRRNLSSARSSGCEVAQQPAMRTQVSRPASMAPSQVDETRSQGGQSLVGQHQPENLSQPQPQPQPQHANAANLEKICRPISGLTDPVASVVLLAIQKDRAKKIHGYDNLQRSIYKLARDIQGRSLSAAQKNVLERVTQVRSELKNMLPLGRVNVPIDGQSIDSILGSVRHQAAKRVRFRDQSFHGGSDHVYARAAAITAYAGCGSCGDFANLAMVLLARDLKAGERLIKQSAGSGFDHAWVRFEGVEPQGVRSGAKPSVILDAWADGPVFLPEDGTWTNNEASVKDNWFIDSSNSQQVYETFEHYRNSAIETKLLGTYGDVFLSRLKNNGDPAVIDGINSYHPMSALSNDFFEKSRAAIEDNDLQGDESVMGMVLDIAEKHKQNLNLDPETIECDIFESAYSFREPEKRFLANHVPVDLGLVPSVSQRPEEASQATIPTTTTLTTVSRRLSLN